MKYLSVDIETTGLDYRVHDLLEVAFVLEDTANPLPLYDLPKLELLIRTQTDTYNVCPFTALMHKRIWELFIEGKTISYTHECIPDYLTDWLISLGLGSWKIVFAGKNAAGFDLPFLFSKGNWGSIKRRMSHRVIDSGSMLIDFDQSVPSSLDECMAKLALPVDTENRHTALGDALDVIRFMRACYNLHHSNFGPVGDKPESGKD